MRHIFIRYVETDDRGHNTEAQVCMGREAFEAMTDGGEAIITKIVRDLIRQVDSETSRRVNSGNVPQFLDRFFKRTK